jgi:hypothetical protein
MSENDNLLTAGSLTVSNGISANTLNVNSITCSSIDCEELNQLSVQNMQSLDTISSLTDQFSEVDSRLAVHDASLSAIQVKNNQQDASLNTLFQQQVVQDSSLNILATHQVVQDASLNILATHQGVQDSSLNALTTHQGVQDSSLNVLTTHQGVQDASLNALTTHQGVQDSSISSNSSSISSNSGSITTLQTKTQKMSYDSSDGSTVVSRAGSINNPTLKITDTGSKALYFLANASDNAYNYLVEANDSVIAYSDALSIVPYINSSNGIRMTKSLVKIGSTSSQPEYGLDNCITFNGTARTIEFVSPNWIVSNQSLYCPDYYLSGTNESISNIIGNLRNADTTETTNRTAADTTITNNLNTEISNRTAADTTLTNSVNTLNTKTSYLTTSGGDSHFSSNVAIDNLSSIYFSRTYNYSTPLAFLNASQPLFVVKSMVSFYMSSEGPQLMTGGSTFGCSIARDSAGVYFLTIPSTSRQTLTTFSAGGSTFYSCSAQINCAQSSLLSGWTVKTHGNAGDGVIACFVREGGESPSLADLPPFQTGQQSYITVFCY